MKIIFKSFPQAKFPADFFPAEAPELPAKMHRKTACSGTSAPRRLPPVRLLPPYALPFPSASSSLIRLLSRRPVPRTAQPAALRSNVDARFPAPPVPTSMPFPPLPSSPPPPFVSHGHPSPPVFFLSRPPVLPHPLPPRPGHPPPGAQLPRHSFSAREPHPRAPPPASRQENRHGPIPGRHVPEMNPETFILIHAPRKPRAPGKGTCPDRRFCIL